MFVNYFGANICILTEQTYQMNVLASGIILDCNFGHWTPCWHAKSHHHYLTEGVGGGTQTDMSNPTWRNVTLDD